MIEVKNLKKYYIDNKSITKVIDDISFKINKGEIVSIVGKSGSGKTTLLNLILGILKMDDGNILYDNLLINKKSKKKKLRGITKIVLSSFQYPDYQLFNKTVKEEFLFNNNIDEKEMIKLMDILSFPIELLDKSPFKLSFGEKRKVILISLLLQKPSVLLLDEPTSALDAKSRKEFISLLLKINKEYKTTLIFVSHDIESLALLNSRTILLKEGKITDFKNVSLAMKEF
jgi:energy-coupling factor transport system ATP-binding protein